MLTRKIGRLLLTLGVLLIAFNTSFSGAASSTALKRAPLNPDFVNYFAQAKAGQLTATDSVAPVTGYIPGPVSFKHLIQKSLSLNTKAKLPSRYDLRSKNKLTPVKEQVIGTCWSFATYASLESCLLPGETWDFSENHLKNTHGFDWPYNVGGNAKIATAYFARWSGPVAESADPYNSTNGISPSGLSPVKHIQKVTFMPLRTSATDNTAIKNAIMSYGALYTVYYHDDSCYNPTTASYYYNGSADSDHAVAIVGWDDNYSKSNFLSIPSGNGAFIVKNSWGKNWGESGYFYVSYYDAKFGREDNVQFRAVESTSNYSQIYQYDPLGMTNVWGFESDTAWFANVFTATKTASLRAVSFYTLSTSNTYTIKIYTGIGSLPTSGKLVATQTGKIDQAGYNTISLTTPASLLANQKFAVVVKLTTSGYKYPISVEEPIRDYSSSAKASSGQSYISSNGKSWIDLTSDTKNTNVCLKAFTK